MDILCVALFGEATSESRDHLFSNNATVEVKGDAGQLISSHPDWEELTYAEIIETFSEEDDHVHLPRIVTSCLLVRHQQTVTNKTGNLSLHSCPGSFVSPSASWPTPHSRWWLLEQGMAFQQKSQGTIVLFNLFLGPGGETTYWLQSFHQNYER